MIPRVLNAFSAAIPHVDPNIMVKYPWIHTLALGGRATAKDRPRPT